MCCLVLDYIRALQNGHTTEAANLRGIANNYTSFDSYIDVREAHSLNKYILQMPLCILIPEPGRAAVGKTPGVEPNVKTCVSAPSLMGDGPISPLHYMMLHRNHFSPFGCGSVPLTLFVIGAAGNFDRAAENLHSTECELSKPFIDLVKKTLAQMEKKTKEREEKWSERAKRG